MYNRYVPQADGSYRRSRVPEQKRQSPPQQAPAQPKPPTAAASESAAEPLSAVPEQPKALPCPKAPSTEAKKPTSSRKPTSSGQREPNHPHGDSVGGFLRQLLPKDFDTGDLLVVLLLLLMAGDCAEDQNTALLTLALYFLM